MHLRSALILGLVWLNLSSVAAANGLPLGARPENIGGALTPAVQTTVEVLHEHLLLDLRERTGKVSATYKLRNRGDAPVELTVAFPVPRLTTYDGRPIQEVRLDGTPVDATSAQRPVTLSGAELSVADDWLDPFSARPYRPPIWGPRQEHTFLLFPISFSTGQERALEVTYSQWPSVDYSRFFNPSYRYDYALLPARRWAGFGSLQVEVLAPNGKAVAADPALVKQGPGRYGAVFSGLPDRNLRVFVGPGPGSGVLPSLWWQRSGRAWSLALLTVLGAATGAALRLTGRPALKQAGVAVSLVTALAVLILTPGNLFQPNPIGLMQTWFLFVPGLMALMILGSLAPGWVHGARPRGPTHPE